MDFLPSLPTLAAFAAATLLLAATPGPDMTLSISRALAQGNYAMRVTARSCASAEMSPQASVMT